MSNLLEKASIITTPTAYEDGKLLSVKPVKTFGSELITNNGFDTDTDWTKGTGWSISGGVAIANNVPNLQRLQQGVGASVVGKKYKYSLNITNVSGFYSIYIFGVYVSATSNTQGTIEGEVIATSTNGAFWVAAASAGGLVSATVDNVSVKEVIDADFDFTRGSSATRVNSQGFIEDVTGTNTPRIDYLGGTGSILLEPASTNRTLNSEQPSTWHSSNNMTITADATTSPDGTSNASLAVISGTSGARYTRNYFEFTTGTGTQTVTGSYFVKYYNNQWVRIRTNFFSGNPANGKNSFFDIQNGVLGTVDATHNCKIEDYGNGWYRCSVTFDIDKDSDVNGYLHLEPMSSDDTNTYPSIGKGYYAFGSQGEELSYPTSYIPTTLDYGSRIADLCNNSGSSDLINSTEGVLYTEFSCIANDGETRIISLSEDGNTNNRINVFQTSGSNRIKLTVRVNSTNVFNETITISNILNYNKIALSYKENEFKIYINGVKEQEQLSGSIYPANTLDKLNFDQGGGAFDFYGNVKCVAVFQEALTDTELECLTRI